MAIALTIAIGLLAAALVGCAVLARGRAAAVAAEHETRARNDSLREELLALRTTIEVARERQRAAEELLKNAQDTFKAVAGDVLRQSSEDFLKLAAERLKVEQGRAGEQFEARRQAIEQLIAPVKETLEKYNASLRQIEAARQGAYESLTKDLEIFRADQRRLREETASLVRALRRPEVRGRWGELQLRRVVELAGMIEYCDFEEQATVAAEAGRLRPDMVIRLPADRCIVIDAKTPIDAFLDSLDCAEEAARAECLRRHADQLDAKVRELVARNYPQQFDRSVDFVVLFIPGESFLQAAAEQRPKLIESAMERGVVIATPATLISLLRAVALGWREQRMARDAEKISREATVLHERLCTLAGHIDRVGSSLGKAVESYNQFIRSLDTRLVPSIRKLEELHARSSRQMPELTTLDSAPLSSLSLPSPVESLDEV